MPYKFYHQVVDGIANHFQYCRILHIQYKIFPVVIPSDPTHRRPMQVLGPRHQYPLGSPAFPLFLCFTKRPLLVASVVHQWLYRSQIPTSDLPILIIIITWTIFYRPPLKVLRRDGISMSSLHAVFRSSSIVSKITCCAPAWLGTCSAADRNRLDSFHFSRHLQ